MGIAVSSSSPHLSLLPPHTLPLLQNGVLPMGSNPSRTATARVLCKVPSINRRLLQHGPFCMDTAPACSCAGWLQLPSGYPPAVAWVPPWSASITMVLFMGCQEMRAPVPREPLPPPSSLTLVSAEFSLTFSHSSLSQLLQNVFYPFLSVLSLRCHQHHQLAQLWAAVSHL